jgi:FKBP-type peptidyl-prolyl cis-trans isomerase 2
MQEQVNNRIEEIMELEGNPFTLPEVTDEEVIKLGNYYLSGEYLIRNLEIVRERKQKALEELAHLEAAEKEILERMVKMQINHKSDFSQ